MNTRLLAVIAFASIPLTAAAASLDINPGLWETTMTRTNPMTGAPTIETSTECVREESFDPRQLMEDTENCQLTNENLSGDTLTFTMQCNIEGGAQATMEGTFQTDGQNGTGNMTMNMNMAGMSMSMTGNWTAKRVGDC